MSFWKHSPGPTWWDCIETLNPCVQPPHGICNPTLLLREKNSSLSNAYSCKQLTASHAQMIETFLKEHFSLYPRCRIVLSKERIYQGLLHDNWIGVGIFTRDKMLIGCCFSKPLGRMKFPQETLDQGGLVDYFCVHKNYRKLGLASYMLEELMHVTAKQRRIVHIFLKEGFPLFSLPPLYMSHYITRERDKASVGDARDYIGASGIATHTYIQNYSHAEYLPLTKFFANLPYQMQGDSELFVFNYRGHAVFICMTDLHHRTVPEGKTIGELSWVLPQTLEVPLSIQKLAVETCIDCGKYDIVLMDAKFPHSKTTWKRDASFSWYIFNYRPDAFLNVKPFLLL